MKITAKENNLNDMQLSYKHAFFQEPLRIGLQTHVSHNRIFWLRRTLYFIVFLLHVIYDALVSDESVYL